MIVRMANFNTNATTVNSHKEKTYNVLMPQKHCTTAHPLNFSSCDEFKAVQCGDIVGILSGLAGFFGATASKHEPLTTAGWTAGCGILGFVLATIGAMAVFQRINN